MPNHITNVITIQAPEGRSHKEVLDFVASENQLFDFNKLIPMPQIVVDSIGTPGINPLWYGWSNENWGTKWNAYETSIKDNVIRFQTAWSAPAPIFHALHEEFKDFTFDIKFADEDLGFNFGHFTYHGLPAKGTAEARLWVCQNVKEEFPDYIDENGNYIDED